MHGAGSPITASKFMQIFIHKVIFVFRFNQRTQKCKCNLFTAISYAKITEEH
jgi:hypothetical protein